MPAWTIFTLSALAVIAAGIRLSRDGDTIAERTGLGGAWIGAILVAGATSLPELATDFFAVRQGEAPLAVGDLFGSCMANVAILAVADLFTLHVRVLTRVAINQVLVGILAILLIAMAVAGSVAHLDFALLGMGWGPLAIAATYLLGMRLLHMNRAAPPFETAAEAAAHQAAAPELRRAIVGFTLSALVILAAARFLAASAADLAAQLGISTGFVGTVLLALTTSLPEATVSFAAVRAGSYDLAVGNLLGSNAFNMLILAVLDVANGPAPLLSGIGPGLLAAGVFAIMLTAVALLGVLNKSEKRMWLLEPDAVSLLGLYFGGLYVVYRVGH